MNHTFETRDFEKICQFIKPLLDECNEVRIRNDGEDVYMVDYCDPVFAAERFVLFDEEHNKLDGFKVVFVEEDD